MTKIVKMEAFKKQSKDVEPYELVDGDKKVVINKPKSDDIVELGALGENANPKQVLQLMCGDKYEDFMGIVGDYDIDVLTAVLEDLQKHFFGDKAPLASSQQSTS